MLDRVGWVQDVAINRRTRRLVDVHRHVELARRRESPIPLVYVDLDAGELWVSGASCAVWRRHLPGDVQRLTGGAKAEWMRTDPPYGVGYRGGTSERLTIANDWPQGCLRCCETLYGAREAHAL